MAADVLLGKVFSIWCTQLQVLGGLGASIALCRAFPKAKEEKVQETEK